MQTNLGYIMDFPGHGAFAPTGKVGEMSKEEIETHNRLLGEAEWAGMLKAGRGVLYLTCHNKSTSPSWTVAQWNGRNSIPCHTSQSLQFVPNCLTRVYRTDVWFRLDGSNWHGVNIGDNQIVRVKRCKR